MPICPQKPNHFGGERLVHMLDMQHLSTYPANGFSVRQKQSLFVLTSPNYIDQCESSHCIDLETESILNVKKKITRLPDYFYFSWFIGKWTRAVLIHKKILILMVIFIDFFLNHIPRFLTFILILSRYFKCISYCVRKYFIFYENDYKHENKTLISLDFHQFYSQTIILLNNGNIIDIGFLCLKTFLLKWT